MKTVPFSLRHGRRLWAVVRAVGLVGAALSGLVGCADTHWALAVYQGARYGNDQCQLRRSPSDAPCAELVDYDHYTQERAKARNAPALSNSAPAIEEQQL